jgi:hypothetical protein
MDSPHVAGWLSHQGEVIEVLNLQALTPENVIARKSSPESASLAEVQA